MAKSALQISEKIRDLMQNSGVDVMTVRWPNFYKIAERERWKSAFQDELTLELRKMSLLASFGNSVVVIAKDFDFSPLS